MRKLNGWQRIWFVLTILMVLYAVGLSYFAAFKYDPSSWDYRQAVIKDLQSPSCTAYTTIQAVGQLPEPPFSNGGGTCWYIYTSRKSDKSTTVPYNIEVYDADQCTYRRGQFGMGTVIFGIVAVVVSGLLYLVGFTIAWIRRGFHKPV